MYIELAYQITDHHTIVPFVGAIVKLFVPKFLLCAAWCADRSKGILFLIMCMRNLG